MSNVWKLQDRDEPVTDAEAVAILQRIAWCAGGPDRDDIISACHKAIAALLKASLAARRKTNADRIRQMSDEELAKYLGTELDGCVGRKCVINDNTDCQKCWFDWLEEVDE